MLSLKQPDTNIVTLVAPNGGVVKDVPVLVGGLVVIPTVSADAGDEFAAHTRGVFKLPKATGTGTDFAAGYWVMWDASEGEVVYNQTASGDFDLGRVRKAVTTSDTEVEVVLGGTRRKEIVRVDITDVSAASDSTVNLAPFAGRVTRVFSRLGGSISGADAAVTPKIGSTAITGGGLTIANSGSAAGDVDVAYPTALNTVAFGDGLVMSTDGASSTTATLAGFFEVAEL